MRLLLGHKRRLEAWCLLSAPRWDPVKARLVFVDARINSMQGSMRSFNGATDRVGGWLVVVVELISRPLSQSLDEVVCKVHFNLQTAF
jgi:hypothetical protein